MVGFSIAMLDRQVTSTSALWQHGVQRDRLGRDRLLGIPAEAIPDLDGSNGIVSPNSMWLSHPFFKKIVKLDDFPKDRGKT